MKIAIVGGGIGGMTLALALHDAGMDDVEVYESAPAVKELGVGINVMPHAVRELTELGLLDDLTAVGIPTAEFVLYSKHGQRIWGEPRGLAAGYRWPQFSIHRGELLGVLHRAVLDRLGPARVHTGHHLARFGQQDGKVWGEFVDRQRGAAVGRVEADLLVGCDGIHSVVRQALYPNEGPPNWNGITMWRGVTEGKPYLTGRSMLMAGYSGRQLVVYPISKRLEDQGRALINWVAEVKTADGRPMPDAGLGPHRPPRGRPRPVRLVRLRLPRRAGADPRGRGHSTSTRWWIGTRCRPGTSGGSRSWATPPTRCTRSGRTGPRRRSSTPGSWPASWRCSRRSRRRWRPTTPSVARPPPPSCWPTARDGPERPLGSRGGAGARRVRAYLDDVVSQEELEEIATAYKRTAGFDPETLNNRPSLSVRAASGHLPRAGTAPPG